LPAPPGCHLQNRPTAARCNPTATRYRRELERVRLKNAKQMFSGNLMR
jgi:hypothetical protein